MPVGLTEDELEAMKAGDMPEELPTEEPETETVEETAPEPEATPEPEPAEELTAEQFAPKYEAQNTDNLAEQYETLNANYEALSERLADQHEAGELSFKEYSKAQNNLNVRYYTERSGLDAVKFEAQVIEKQNTQTLEQLWAREQAEFFKANPDFKDDVVRDALIGTMNRLYLDPLHEGKSSSEILRISAKKVGERFSIDTKATAKPKAIPARHAAELPTTLANVPAAASNIEAGEFDHLDKLDGVKLEVALAKMSIPQRKRFEQTLN